MKKIDKLFIHFPELKLFEKWIRVALVSKKFHPIKNAYKRYTLRKPKFLDKAVKIMKEGSSHTGELMWAPMYLDLYYWGSLLFEDLNRCFLKLKENKGFNGLLNHLKNSDQFFDTISEIRFNAYFCGRYDIEIEPKINYSKNHKKLDSKIKLDKRNVYFEIITPRMSRRLKSKQVVTLGNRSKNKILDKLDKQIKPIINKIKSPLVIVVNRSYSDIDEIDIQDTLLGQSQYTFFISKNPNEPVPEGYFSRAKNAIVDSHPYGEIISAIVIYRYIKHLWGVEFKKEVILNKRAKYPLTSEEYKKLNRFNLANI